MEYLMYFKKLSTTYNINFVLPSLNNLIQLVEKIYLFVKHYLTSFINQYPYNEN